MAEQSDEAGLASALGATALMTAAAQVRAAATGAIDDPFAEPLLKTLGVEQYQQIARGEADPFDEYDLRSLTIDLLVAGSRFFDDFLAEAGRAGIRQVVLLASGLDTRPYRLWWPAGTRVYEVDQAEVMEFKTRTLRDLGAKPTGHRRAVGIDLSQDWPSALQHIGFDIAQPSVWIAQGQLLGVLAPEVGDQLLDGVSALSCAGSRFAADLTVPIRPYAHTVDGRHDIAGHLHGRGWATAPVSAGEVLAVTGHPPWPASSGRPPIQYLRATRR